MKSVLKLHPHKHTGKLLHHRHTSYPALFLLLALTGAVLLAPMGMARADNIVVDAIVPAPLPPGPATITSPATNTVTPGPNVTISGSCPVINPPIIVVLYDGTTILGSSYCDNNGMFVIPVSLTIGSHSIVPSITNFTGQSGANGTPILITYTPSNAPTQHTTTVTNTVTTTTPTKTVVPVDDNYPIIIADSAFVTFGPHKDAIFKASLKSGTPPYGIMMNWGDGTVQRQQGIKIGSITLRHHYQQQKLYPLRFEVRDAIGHILGISSVAVSPAAYAGSDYTDQPAATGILSNLPGHWLLFSVYITTVMALTLFWRHEHLRYAYQPLPVRTTRRAAPVKRSRGKR